MKELTMNEVEDVNGGLGPLAVAACCVTGLGAVVVVGFAVGFAVAYFSN